MDFSSIQQKYEITFPFANEIDRKKKTRTCMETFYGNCTLTSLLENLRYL